MDAQTACLNATWALLVVCAAVLVFPVSTVIAGLIVALGAGIVWRRKGDPEGTDFDDWAS
jgi:hypothetical protein